jgi:hypothetical protein
LFEKGGGCFEKEGEAKREIILEFGGVGTL